jgi:predicted amidohydrolase YtcJ
LLITISLHAQSDSSHLVLQHVNLIDGFSRKALPDQTVTIRGGKIVGIAKKAAPAVPGAVVIDLRGQWLLPGYVDAHVHFGSPAAAQAPLRNGVTTARTMNTFHYQDVTLRERHKAGGYQLRPDMFDAFFKDFPALTDLKPRVTGTENVRRLVRANVERG